MPDFTDIEKLITTCRAAHGIPEENLIYDWPLSDRQLERLTQYLEGINDEQIGTEDGTVSLFRNFSQALHRTVETGNVDETVRIIANILDWGGIHGNKPKTLLSYARQLHIVGILPEDAINMAMEEFYYSKQTGIASWSKILAAWEPESFFIYDANVAVALQIIYAGRFLFYLPPSESAAVKSYYRDKFNNLGKGEYVDYRGYCEELRQMENGNRLEKRLFMLGRRLTR